MHVARVLLLAMLLLAAPAPADGKKKKSGGRSASGAAKKATEKSEQRPFTQAHPEQPRYEQISEEEAVRQAKAQGSEIKKIREGEVLNLAENAEKEAAREQPEEVVHMFDAVMSDDFGSLNKVLKEEKVPVDIRGPNGCVGARAVCTSLTRTLCRIHAQLHSLCSDCARARATQLHAHLPGHVLAQDQRGAHAPRGGRQPEAAQ